MWYLYRVKKHYNKSRPPRLKLDFACFQEKGIELNEFGIIGLRLVTF